MPNNNLFNGLIMNINFEEKEWTGDYLNICSLCGNEFIFTRADKEADTPVVLTYIQNTYLDQDKYSCNYDHMEDWLNKFVAN